ncbi:MAG: DUF6326 family protein [Bacteroidota bacterium]
MILTTIRERSFLSSLWIFILFNMIFRDLHEFLREGFIEEMMALQIPEANMLFFAIILEIPIAMVILSRMLPDKANRWANTLAGCVFLFGLLASLPSGDWDDVFFGLVNVMAVGLVLFAVWKRD